MQVHNLETGRVITLDESEQFAFIPPTDEPDVVAFESTKANGITVIADRPDQPGYYTVSGVPIHGAGSDDERYWTVPQQYTDSGPLPPYVRAHVEDLVPVADRGDNAGAEQVLAKRRVGFDQLPTEQQEAVVADVSAAELHRYRPTIADRADGVEYVPSIHGVGVAPGPLSLIESDQPLLRRLEDRNRLALLEHAQLPVPELHVAAPLPGSTVPQLPPSAFLDAAQVRGGR